VRQAEKGGQQGGAATFLTLGMATGGMAALPMGDRRLGAVLVAVLTGSTQPE